MGKSLTGKELGKGITQRKDGLYYARALINGYNISLYNSNLSQLKNDFQRAKDDITRGLNIKSANLTVGEWFNDWFDTYKAPTLKPTSVFPTKNRAYNTFIKPFECLNIRTLSSIDVQKHINYLLESGKSASTIRSALSTFRRCMESARNNGMILIDPTFDINVPWEFNTEKNSRYLTSCEQTKFLEACKGNFFEEIFYIMLHTGLRIGEVGGLVWDDIDWKNKCIHINRQLTNQYVNHKKTLKFSDPKTANSKRTIPFIADVEIMLLRWKKKQEQLKRSLGNFYRSKGEFSDLVFVTSAGSPFVRYVAEKTIKNIVRDINLHENYSAIKEGREPIMFEHVYPHALRHTFCCRCFEAGMQPKAIQMLLGHSDIKMTMNVYLHMSSEQLKDETGKFEQLYANIYSQTTS